MTSLFRAFRSKRLEKLPTWQYYLSLACLVLGSIGVVTGVLAASTNLWMMIFGIGFEQSWEAAGVLGTIGGFLILASIPYSTPRVKNAVLTRVEIGAVFVFVGTVIFVYQYPQNWNIFQWDTIALVCFIHLIGLAITLSAALNAVIGFEVRKTPGGEVKMHVESDGEQITAEIEESTLRDKPHYALEQAVDKLDNLEVQAGGVGLLGGLPTEYYETQTNRPETNHADD